MRYHPLVGWTGGAPPVRYGLILLRQQDDVERIRNGRRTIEILISPAFAHGSNPGETVGGAGPLVLVAGIFVFVLFLVIVHRMKGKKK